MDDERVVFRGRIFRVVTIPRPGRDGPWEVVRHPGAAAVLAVVDGGVVLVRQERRAVNDSLWELPAGLCDPGEQPIQTARRELAEETGYHGGRWNSMGSVLTSPGFSDEEVFLFSVLDPQPGPPDPDPGEDLRVSLTGEADIRAMIAGGEIRDAKTLLALVMWLGGGVT